MAKGVSIDRAALSNNDSSAVPAAEPSSVAWRRDSSVSDHISTAGTSERDPRSWSSKLRRQAAFLLTLLLLGGVTIFVAIYRLAFSDGLSGEPPPPRRHLQQRRLCLRVRRHDLRLPRSPPHPPGVFALQLPAPSLYFLVYAAGASAQRRERRRKHDRLLREAPEDADRLAVSLLDVKALRAEPFRLDHPLNLLLHLLLATALPMLCEVVEAAIYPDGGEGPLELARAAVPPHMLMTRPGPAS